MNEIPGIGSRNSYAPIISIPRSTLRPYPRAVIEKSRGSKITGHTPAFIQNTDPWDTYGWNTFLNFAV